MVRDIIETAKHRSEVGVREGGAVLGRPHMHERLLGVGNELLDVCMYMQEAIAKSAVQ